MTGVLEQRGAGVTLCVAPGAGRKSGLHHGALSLAASSALGFFGAPEALSIVIGGAIGFLGVTTIREFLVRWVGKRADQ